MSSHFFLFSVFQLFLITLTILAYAQNQSGFISIDCGLIDEQSYTDETTSISYTSDSTFISNGISHTISSKNNLQRQFWNLRSFPEGSRNCYTLDAPTQSGNTKYLVRARFMYGNYDGKESLPQFDLFLGSKWWDSVVFENEESVVTKEIIYSASSSYVHVCLFNTNNGTPFISVLELRVVDSGGFLDSSLELLDRFDLGLQDGELVRYPDDIYDRIWTPYNTNNWKQINTSLPIEQGSSSSSSLEAILPPSIVMRTASTSENMSQNLEFHYLQNSKNSSTCYAYMYFAEIQKLQENQTREFNIFVNGSLLNASPTIPFYLQSIYYLAVLSESSLDIWINKTDRSTLPPLINAIEIYMTKDFSQSQTDQTDADAIMNIKSTYGIKRNWQGDPCTPQDYLWDGLNCSYNGSGSQRIISLNLSSNGLSGNIAPDISNLKLIEYLDLSNNSLVGNVPIFLSQLHSLRVLNLEGNQLSGTIPTELTERSKNGSLKFSFGGNPNLCSSDSCNSSKTNVVIPVVASLAGAFILLAVIITFCIFKRRQKRRKQEKLNSYSIINKDLKSKKQQLTYAEVSSITNNFERLVGKGAFGTVYYGLLGNTEVAVKILSPSTQGYLQFQVEAKLLARVHHKCLTALIGFCDDGTNIALIYEYMANGDLGKHLSEKNENILDWKQRLQIAVDAAEGLEYLHKGCKPPIIHRDVKSNNILLNETFRGKIADFGLSKMFPEEDDTHVFTVIAGTPGYLDPEYNKSNKLNEKSDVYSYGVVLLEIITGRPAIAKATEEKAHIVEWVNFMVSERENIDEIVDSRLQGNFDTDCARKALNIAVACVSPTSLNRPIMSEVVMDLRQCLAMETTPSVPYSQIDFSFGGMSGQSSLAR